MGITLWVIEGTMCALLTFVKKKKKIMIQRKIVQMEIKMEVYIKMSFNIGYV